MVGQILILNITICQQHVFSGTRMSALATHLEQFMYQYAGLVDHRKVEWSPVLKEREIQELVVDGEVVVKSIFILGGRSRTSSGSRAKGRLIPSFRGQLIESMWRWWGMGESREI